MRVSRFEVRASVARPERKETTGSRVIRPERLMDAFQAKLRLSGLRAASRTAHPAFVSSCGASCGGFRGVAYADGRGVLRDLLFFGGRGVPQDYAEAAKWFRKAADQGNADAQYGLGLLYFKGLAV